MDVDEARSKFFEAKTRIEDCRRSISELQTKCDTLEESMPRLNRAVENTEKAKTAALDNFAMTSNKQTEAALKAARAGFADTQKKLSETHELVEATHRALTKQQAELARFNNAYDLARRELWQAVADEIKNNIPAHILEAVKNLLVAGVQCSQTRQFILDTLFPNIPSEEFQTIRSELVEKYEIDE